MNKLKVLFIALAISLVPASAWAYRCEESQGFEQPSNCYTEVKLSSNETNLVSQGHALVWEIDALNPKQGQVQVVRSRGSADTAFLAGFAQEAIASGTFARVLVRGYGFVRTVGGVASLDNLYVTTSGNVGTIAANESVSTLRNIVSNYPVAVAMETSTTNGTTARRAWIKAW